VNSGNFCYHSVSKTSKDEGIYKIIFLADLQGDERWILSSTEEHKFKYFRTKCYGYCLNKRKVKLCENLGYYITRNSVIYTRHLVLLGG
jgi:hypothetical protein